jgi:hypothetical protein
MLWTTDTKALQHILSNSYVYQKPEMGRYFLGRVVGPGAEYLVNQKFGVLIVLLNRCACRRGRYAQEAGEALLLGAVALIHYI